MLKKRNHLFLLMAVALFCNTSCAYGSTQRSETQPENSKVASVSETPKASEKSVTSSERMTSTNKAVTEEQTSNATKSDCSHNIKGAGSRKIKIPSELCFNEKKPADKSEVVPSPPRGQKQANTLYDIKVPVREVPTEVLQVVELIMGKKTTAKEFSLIASPNGEDSTRRNITIYLYSPITDDIKDSGTFYFQKQNGKRKLVLADVAE
jgi:hypothetical protein